MQLPSRRKIAMARTAWRALTAYGALKHAQGRLAARRSAGSRKSLMTATGGALVVGAGAGLMLGARGGCGHDHDHDHGDQPAAPAGEQAPEAATA